jgi:hypothetical protein
MIKSRMIRWAEHVARLRRIGMYIIFWWENEKAVVISRRRLDDNIEMDLREVEWGVMDWIQLAQDRDQ